MQYIHTCNTYMKYIHTIHTCNTCMKYIHEIQSKNGGISVTGTPTIALENIWRVLTYVVSHTEFAFSIKLGGYGARMSVFKVLLRVFVIFQKMSKIDFETCYPM